MSEHYHIEEFVYSDSLNGPLYELFQEVSLKYPGGIYWSHDPNSNEGKHIFLCLDQNNKLIGKGHVMIFEEQEDDAPAYAEHRIFMHYRVLPEYEQDEEALDLLYSRLFECASELRKTLSNRACQLCIGNHDFETVYNDHIEKIGWPEHGSIYHLSCETNDTEHLLFELDGMYLHEFLLDNIEILRQLVTLDQICFRESIASLDNYMDLSKENYLAVGAFVRDKKGVETIIGSVISVFEDGEQGNSPEIVAVMVSPDYRRKHIAETLVEMALDSIHKKGYKKTWLVTPCTNAPAITLYQKLGFRIFSHEKRRV